MTSKPARPPGEEAAAGPAPLEPGAEANRGPATSGLQAVLGMGRGSQERKGSACVVRGRDCKCAEWDALGRAGTSPPGRGEIPVSGEGISQARELLVVQLAATCLDSLADASRILQEGPNLLQRWHREEEAHEQRVPAVPRIPPLRGGTGNQGKTPPNSCTPPVPQTPPAGPQRSERSEQATAPKCWVHEGGRRQVGAGRTLLSAGF
eukprot:XP_027321899.1 uncharacterized protein LOC113844822 isoform X1 [Anas platyrhynchos]